MSNLEDELRDLKTTIAPLSAKLANGSIDEAEVNLLTEMLDVAHNNSASVVQCSRYETKDDSQTIPMSYKFYQFFYRSLVKSIFGEKVNDSTYAFKVFNRADAIALGMTSNRFSISPEITFKAMLSGKRVEFVKGAQGVRKAGLSKFKFMKEGPGFIYCLARAALHKTGIAFWF
jgi:dolichol-phosphate mannosyltransferase